MSFGRVVKFRIGSTEYLSEKGDDLRMSFDVVRTKSRDPNEATLRVWGLNEASRNRLEAEPRQFCEIFAGYSDETIDRIFSGVLLESSSSVGVDVITTLTMGDDAKQKAVNVVLSRRFPSGTPHLTVIRELAKALGFSFENIAQFTSEAKLEGSAVLSRSWSVQGSVLQALHTFARSLGYQYTIQNRSVVLIGLRATETRGPLIKGDECEAPSLDAEGTVKFTCRLKPGLMPGTAFQLDTEAVKGSFIAVSTRHSGDTHAGEFVVECEGDSISKVLKNKVVQVV